MFYFYFYIEYLCNCLSLYGLSKDIYCLFVELKPTSGCVFIGRFCISEKENVRGCSLLNYVKY